jgi:methyl-accepting chemotaxis protein
MDAVRRRGHGMTIRRTLVIAFGGLVAVLLVLAGTTWATLRQYEAVARSEDRRLRSQSLAAQLRASSDELTRMARTYVVTGDPRFETYFQAILDIRNGVAPRPEGYEGVYWDLVTATHRRPPTAAAPAALLDLMREAGFTAAEFAALRTAQERSDALVALEDRAMHAMKGRFRGEDGNYSRVGEPDPQLARSLVHGPEYHEAKAQIMAPVQTFLDLVGERTRAEVTSARASAGRLTKFSVGLAAAATLFAIVAMVALRRRVVGPIADLAQRMEDIASGAGDLTRRVDVGRRRDEIGALGTSFNVFVNRIQESLRRVSDATGEVSVSCDRLLASTRRQEATADVFAGATGAIASAVTEISASAQEMASTVKRVSRAARESTAAALAGSERLAGMERTMRDLLTATDELARRLAGIDERAQGITGVITTIVRVADQTNLLSLNAAIEAEKAGVHGRGFLVVAQEVGRLADHTAAATLEIERAIHEMRDTVASGVTEMQRFGGQVRRTFEDATAVAGEIGGVIERVRGVTEQFAQVDEGISQQALGSDQVRASTDNLRSEAGAAQGLVGDVRRSVQSLGAAVVALRDTLDRFRL